MTPRRETPTRVMVVDDQKPARFGLTLLVNKASDLEVTGQATNGREALETLVKLREDKARLPDVILMDIRMPLLNGIDATAEVVSSFPKVKVLVMTTYDQDDYALGALDAGASGYLLKDTRAEQLHRAIRDVAGGDAVLTPRITAKLLDERRPARRRSTKSEEAQRLLNTLSPRESEVAELVAQGYNNAEIADALVLQQDSVKKTVSRILTRLDLRDRVQIVVLWHTANAE